MSVYFIRAGADGPVKIGFSTESSGERLEALQVGAAAELAIMREISGGETVERWVHKRFAAQRIRGEWFEYHPDMLTIEPPLALVTEDDRTSTKRSQSETFINGRFERDLTYLHEGLTEHEDTLAAKLLLRNAVQKRDAARLSASSAIHQAETFMGSGDQDNARRLATYAHELLKVADRWQANAARLEARIAEMDRGDDAGLAPPASDETCAEGREVAEPLGALGRKVA